MIFDLVLSNNIGGTIARNLKGKLERERERDDGKKGPKQQSGKTLLKDRDQREGQRERERVWGVRYSREFIYENQNKQVKKDKRKRDKPKGRCVECY